MLGQYIPGDSILHRIDPRVKIILSIVFLTLVFLIDGSIEITIMLLFMVIIVLISRIPPRCIARSLRPVLLVLLLTAAINVFTTGGMPIFQYGFIHVTSEGLILAATITIRLLLMVTSASLLTFTTTPMALTDGIEKLLQPFRRLGLPAHEIAMMISIAIRFVPILLEEADRIKKAQAARGADFDTGNILQRAKSHVPVLVPLFVSAFRRADDLAVAMESRCYKGGLGRTRMKQLRLGREDLIAAAFMLVFTAGILYIQLVLKISA